MLEDGFRLRTWTLGEPPNSDRSIVAEALQDHRLDYLTYEGPVSGDRGHVSRWDHGEFVWNVHEADRIVIHLRGQRLQGQITLTRDHATQRWLLGVSPDVDSANRD